jgi:hypothetical protein
MQLDFLSALLISAYPAAMILAFALRSGHHPCENIQNDQIGLDLQGDERLVARRLYDIAAVQKTPE